MKRLLFLSLIFIIAGCGEVSVDGEVSNSQDIGQTGLNPGQPGTNTPGCEGDGCETEPIGAVCTDFEMICNDDGQLQYVCKSNASIYSEELCACDKGQSVCKVETELVHDCVDKQYTLQCISAEENAQSVLAITCNNDGNSISDVNICEHGCGLNAQGIASCYQCEIDGDCVDEQQCIKHVCVISASATTEPEPEPTPDVCTAEKEFEYICDEKTGRMKRLCKTDPEKKFDSLVDCPCIVNGDGLPECVQCTDAKDCGEELECIENKCLQPESGCKTNLDCGVYSVCDGGQCVSAPCGSIDSDFSTYHICRSDNIKKYKENKDKIGWNGISNVVFHGRILCNEDCFDIDLRDNVKAVTGINEAVIFSKDDVVVTKPLFKELSNISVSNLKFSYNYKFIKKKHPDIFTEKEGTRGFLANYVNNVKLDALSVYDATIVSDETELVDAGVLVGNAEGNSELNNISIKNVTITLNPRTTDVCSDSKYHRSIGGIIGNAKNVKIGISSIKHLIINSGLAAHVGGVVGTAKSVTVFGNYNSLDEPTEFDISNLTILNAERDAAGILGDVSDEFSIHNLSIQSDSIESILPCAGGVVGYVHDNTNKTKEINTLYVKNNDITAGKYAGGIVGLKEQNSGMNIKKITLLNYGIIKAKLLNADACGDSDNDGQHDGTFAGGLIGKILTGTYEVKLENIKNVFHTIEANVYAGGLVGAISDANMVTIDDVVNVSSSEKSVVSASKSGGFISSVDDSMLSISNVVNEINSISGVDSGGFIARFKTSKLVGPTSIKSVISNVHLSSDGVTAGFIGFVSVFKDGFTGSKKLQISDVVSKSLINTSSDTSSAGFVSTIENFKHDNKDEYFTSIANVLVDNNIYVGEIKSFSGKNNMFNSIYNSKIRLNECPVNTYASYSGYLAKFVSNSFYETYGYLYNGAIADELNDSICQWQEPFTTCMNYKSYKFPLVECWYTDYCSGSQCPVNPLYQFSCTDDEPTHCRTDCSESSSDCSKLLTAPNNIFDVRQSLDFTWKADQFSDQHTWNECSAEKIKNILTLNYDRLLCPILTGERTCMGTWNAEKNKCTVP